jgi:hypothetical protein
MSSFSDGFLYSLGSAAAFGLSTLVSIGFALFVYSRMKRRLVRRIKAPIRRVGEAASSGFEYAHGTVRKAGDAAYGAAASAYDATANARSAAYDATTAATAAARRVSDGLMAKIKRD